jgi:FMN phosphatase YigB (HAD superfamily)
MKKLLIALDIGNVCVKISHQNFPAALGIDNLPDDVKQLMHDYETGKIETEDEFLQKTSAAFQHKFPLEKLKDAFDSILIEAVPGMPELVASFPDSGIKAVFFSDISPTHLKRTELLFSAFHTMAGGVFSFKSGSWKPGEAMFSMFEKNYGTPDFYFDDRADLVEAARKHGWNAIVFTSAKDLREKIMLAG